MGVMKVRDGVGTFIEDGPAEFNKSSLGLMALPDFSLGRCLRPV